MSNDARAYRPDIDGLRALAVVPVILYHAGVAAVPGGYVGVDVFFVISGYLITGILLRETGASGLSIAAFYERRIRRILPALFAMLLAVLAAGWFLLLPQEFNDLGNALAAATFFYSNYHFMGEAGYFAAPAETQPLLHTWSLAVEEQFYIVFPLLLTALVRFGRHRLTLMLAALAAISLGYGIWLVGAWPESAFYSTPARAWELLLGALLAAQPVGRTLPRAAVELLAAAGCLGILAAVLAYDRATPFPGLAALLPCLGTAAAIRAGEHASTATGRLLASPLPRLTGLISYSLYLWHWPIFVLFRLTAMRPPGPGERTALVAATFVIAAASWRWVEWPCRARHVLGRRRPLFLAAGTAMAVALAAGIALSRFDGVPGRLPAEVRVLLAAAEDRAPLAGCELHAARDERHVLRICPLAPGSAPAPEPASFAVWGDSHAEALLPAIGTAAHRAGRSGVFLGRDGCVPLLGVHQVREGYADCVDSNARALAYLAAHPEIRLVLLVARWGLYATALPGTPGDGEPLLIRDELTQAPSVAENMAVFRRGWEATRRELAALGVAVAFVEQVPEALANVPATAARSALAGGGPELRTATPAHRVRRDLVAGLLATAPPEYLLQPWQALCDERQCNVLRDGQSLYRDSNHLTRRAAVDLAGVFEPLLRVPAQGGPGYGDGGG